MVTRHSNIEKNILNEVSWKVPEAVLSKFSTLDRESGSEDERIAAQFLAKFLDEWGVKYTMHTPELYLSLPRSAQLRVLGPQSRAFEGKTPAFSISTDSPRKGQLAYLETSEAKDVSDIFSEMEVMDKNADLEGKVILAEGIPMPGRVKSLEDLGAMAAVFIAPGKRTHNAICTTIWGAPDLDNWTEEPKIPVVSINRQDGDALIELLKSGPVDVEISTELEKGWYQCPILDIFIEGTEEPEKYVLLHGHLDSWHMGISDNATGNAAKLELARIFNIYKDKLRRSLRIAFWTGHSYGRYAGSTWFADTFALDLFENCVAQVNCDSPGCKDATSYDQMMWMPEAEELCKAAILDATGLISKGKRPVRAGDYSFNNIGITSFYMLSSVMPETLKKQKNYYAVGGSGGNIEWHTEDDLCDVADIDLLVRDIKVYAATVYRALNATILPYDFRATVTGINATLTEFQKQAGKHFDFRPARTDAEQLTDLLDQFYANLDSFPEDKVNQALQDLARILVPINYTRRGIFWHDPALEIPPLPDLAPVSRLAAAQGHEYRVIRTHLTRGQNRLLWALRQAKKVVSKF